MDEMTAVMTRFAELRPSEPSLTAHDLAELRRELFPTAAPPADSPRTGRVVELAGRVRHDPPGGRRWLGAATAAVVVLGGAGVWMASDRDVATAPSAPASSSEPSTSEVKPPEPTASTSQFSVPRVAFSEPGWTLTRSYEAPAGAARAVVFLSEDGLGGPWIEVTVDDDGGGALPTIPLGRTVAQVSEFGEGTLLYWTTPSGADLRALGWQVDAAAMAPFVDAVAVTGGTISFGDLPEGAIVAEGDVTEALGRYGEYGFVHDDGRELQVSFYPGGPRAQYGRIGDEDRGEVSVGGETGALAVYGDGRYRVNVQRGFWAWEFDGGPFVSEQAFLDTVAGIGVVDDVTWQTSLPDQIVGADDVTEELAVALVDVPLPNGLDPVTLAPAANLDRYQFVAELSRGVVCAWLDQWFAGQETGDAALQGAAADALATSRNWPMLSEIDDQGGWSGVVWQWADAVNGGAGVATGGGPEQPTRAAAVGALGCPW